MKRVNTILAITLLILTGCGRNKQINEEDGFITVNVIKKYPKKELILQEFMNVEYIPLETGGEFYCDGIVLDIGKNIILIKNRVDDGDIFVFDRNGKGLRKINRKGRGPEEYTFVLDITLDEDNNEMFVHDHTIEKILVYDLFGKYKRSFSYNDVEYDNFCIFDDEHLICFDGSANWEFYENKPSYFAIISKQDGSLFREIPILYKEKKTTGMTLQSGEMMFAVGMGVHPIIGYQGDWILTLPSTDTIYTYSTDNKLFPFIVRIPSIQSMNPEVFLFPGILTDRYYFVESVKKEYNFTTQDGFPSTDLMYDRNEKKIYECKVYNYDYSNKKTVSMMRKTINNEIAFCQMLGADVLVETYKKGELKGKLKGIAENLKEDDNPVIMLVKYKK